MGLLLLLLLLKYLLSIFYNSSWWIEKSSSSLMRSKTVGGGNFLTRLSLPWPTTSPWTLFLFLLLHSHTTACLLACLFVCWWYHLSSSDGSSVLIIRLEWSSCGHQTALLLDRIGNWILYSFLFWSACLHWRFWVHSCWAAGMNNAELLSTPQVPLLFLLIVAKQQQRFFSSPSGVIISQLSSLKKSPCRGSSGAS